METQNTAMNLLHLAFKDENQLNLDIISYLIEKGVDCLAVDKVRLILKVCFR
jgi:hypothetical protein